MTCLLFQKTLAVCPSFLGEKGYVKHVFILQPLGVAIGWGIFDDAISSPKNSTNPRPPQLFNFTVTSFLSYGHPTFQLYSYPKTISTDAHVFKRTNHFSKVPIAQVLQVYFRYHFFQIIASGPCKHIPWVSDVDSKDSTHLFFIDFLFLCFFSLSSPQRFPKKYCQTNWIWYWFWNSIFLIFFASSSAVNSWFFDKGCFLCLCEPLTERKKLNKTTIGVKLKRKSIWIHE